MKKIIKNITAVFLKKTKGSPDDKRLKEAVHWLVQLESESLSSEKQADFWDWLYQDYKNKATFQFVECVWASVGELKHDPMAVQLTESLRSKRSQPSKSRVFQGIRLSLPRIRFAGAAVTALLILASFWLIQTGIFQKQRFITAIGEQKTIALSDGTIVRLDTQTAIEISFNKQFRNIVLKKGKAFFSVAHAPHRPFIVHTDGITAQALGTQFSVYKQERDIAIAVTKGRVQVSSGDTGFLTAPQSIPGNPKEPTAVDINPTPYHLGAPQNLSKKVVESGQIIIVDKQMIRYVIEPVDMKTETAWQEGRLELQNKPLEDVVKEINRYVENRIIIDDDALRKTRINIILKIKNRSDFLKTLEAVIPITYRTDKAGRIIITKKTMGTG
ncbi:MAG: DUF4880 domain-containing protein [Desulfatitalea sp.]|nr:FecR domain-containing protein [Desulfatitalea sp.]NNJ99648.1 DUF4880 domain-containing protein [Desulfatitalea sp.]